MDDNAAHVIPWGVEIVNVSSLLTLGFLCRELVYFGGQNKIILMKSTNGMSPVFDPNLIPANVQIRMMAFAFGYLRDLIYEID